jgi:hypothetical protein
MFSKAKNDQFALGDFRDWTAIRAWAQTLPSKLAV